MSDVNKNVFSIQPGKFNIVMMALYLKNEMRDLYRQTKKPYFKEIFNLMYAMVEPICYETFKNVKETYLNGLHKYIAVLEHEPIPKWYSFVLKVIRERIIEEYPHVRRIDHD